MVTRSRVSHRPLLRNVRCTRKIQRASFPLRFLLVLLGPVQTSLVTHSGSSRLVWFKVIDGGAVRMEWMRRDEGKDYWHSQTCDARDTRMRTNCRWTFFVPLGFLWPGHANLKCHYHNSFLVKITNDTKVLSFQRLGADSAPPIFKVTISLIYAFGSFNFDSTIASNSSLVSLPDLDVV